MSTAILHADALSVAAESKALMSTATSHANTSNVAAEMTVVLLHLCHSLPIDALKEQKSHRRTQRREATPVLAVSGAMPSQATSNRAVSTPAVSTVAVSILDLTQSFVPSTTGATECRSLQQSICLAAINGSPQLLFQIELECCAHLRTGTPRVGQHIVERPFHGVAQRVPCILRLCTVEKRGLCTVEKRGLC